jgi:hypothetical protein
VIGRFVTPETIRLGLSGLAAGSATGLVWRALRRVRWGAAPFLLAVMFAAHSAGRSDWPRWDAMAAAGGLITLLAALGAVHLLADPAVVWGWVAAGSLASAAGVWAGVPETGPALLAGGSLAGLAVTAALTRSRWAPAAGTGVAAVVGWAALSGAAGRPWAVVGGALCAGIAPWFALHRPFPPPPGPTPGRMLFGAHVVLVILAARWIGVAPHAGWGRVAVLAVAGLAVAANARARA